MRFLQKISAPVLAGLLSSVFGLWVSNILFYRVGAYFLDAGLFGQSLASNSAPNIPLRLQDHLGESVFGAHLLMSPYALMQLLSKFVHPVDSFIIFQGVQHGLFVLAAGFALKLFISGKYSTKVEWVLIFSTSMALGFSNIALGTLLYPHPELFGASLCALGLLLLVSNQTRYTRILGLIFLFLGILGREDFAIHLAISAFVVFVLAPSKLGGAKRKFLYMALVFGALGLGLLFFQKIAFPNGGFLFQEMYSGNPPYAHLLSVELDVARILNFVATRMDLTLLTLGGLALFILSGYRFLLVFTLASLPWTVLSLTALDPAKAVLATYHQFPFIIYLTVAALFFSAFEKNLDKDVSPGSGLLSKIRENIAGRSAAVAISGVLFLGGISLPPVGNGYVFMLLYAHVPASLEEISRTHEILSEAASSNETYVDDAVMTLETVGFDKHPMTADIVDELPKKILFMPEYQLGREQITKVIDTATSRGKSIKIECLTSSIYSLTFSSADPLKPQDTIPNVFNYCKNPR